MGEEMIRTDLSNEAYHAHPAISSSDVKAVYLKSLRHWQLAPRKESAAFDLGSAVHALVLEPEKDLVRCGPGDRRGTAWKDAKLAADLDGYILLPQGEYDLAKNIAHAALVQAPEWMDRPRITEGSVFATDRITGVEIKCRPDIYIEADAMVVDLKTCTSASPRQFSRDVHQYGYAIQAAFYMRVLQNAGHEADRFFFFAIEKDAPYAVCIHEIDADYLDTCQQIITQTLLKIRDAQAKGDYTTGWPEVNMISQPGWMTADDPEDF
jgi:exodeoxyribonuclease VIII